MNLSQIIERKKEEFEKSDLKNRIVESDKFYRLHGFPEYAGETVQSFLEKAIRESVEEALREVRPEDYMAKELCESEGGYGMCLDDLDSRVKEFMK